MKVIVNPRIILFFILTLVTLNSYAKDNKYQIQEVAKSLNATDLADLMVIESIYSETIVSEDDKLVFYITGNQKKINNGRRSELAIDYPFNVGDEVIYQFEVFIPPSYTPDSEGRWSVITQWHDQPNPNLGESWQNFPGRSPLVALYDKYLDGKLVFGISYNNDFVPIPLKIGSWNKLNFHFNWSNTHNGSLSLRINDHSNFYFQGPNMHNEYQHYLKIGLYRHPKITNKNHIYFRNLQINSSL
ncbi:heparin lyase I family protein [Aliivibrio sp. S2TY2]|uniref:heparin lyase I family protein n=1 Tax=unclassified Aliivibrio TaxID=2645654 RepID=UPI002379F655|nr:MULTISPECIES: heparin lyase I family protein [unclassified Aliivibrio]MDD9174995.1 heparin lyase I family protein [Aliivibrio sp. S3TY1]MDD9192058.1 heparin lyase I family protein [Aliivibrio sp. S2TY2]